MHCDKLLFYICLSKKKPYRAYVVMLLYSTVNKSSMSMSMDITFGHDNKLNRFGDLVLTFKVHQI